MSLADDLPIEARQRNIPPQPASETTVRSGSSELGLMVAGYLVALFAGIALLGLLTPTSPTMSVVATDATPPR